MEEVVIPVKGKYGIRKARLLVMKSDENIYSVINLNSTFGIPRQYTVKWNGYKWICSCPEYLKNSADYNFVCKHIIAVFATFGKKVVVAKVGEQNENY